MLQEKVLNICLYLDTGWQRPAPSCLGAKNTKLSLDRLPRFVPKICPGDVAESTLEEGGRLALSLTEGWSHCWLGTGIRKADLSGLLPPL